MTLPAPLVIIAMVNGMIGGVILVLPLLSLESGTISTLIILPLSGLFSFYSCYLCVKHLGKESDLDYAMLKHFNGSKFVKIFYDVVVFLNLLFLLVEYFELIVQQWEGLITVSALNQILNGVVLLFFVFILKYFDLGSSILAYGIISIIGYCIFLIWMLASSPSGTNKMPTFGSGSINLASSMGQAFAIQTFFIPVLKKNPNVNSYMFYTALAYGIGTAAYMYIAYAGSFGILNRTAMIPVPQTVQDYFPHGYWEVNILQAIYLIHLYSVFPQFLLISKKRIFSAFGYKGSRQKQVPYPQIIYTVVFIGICMVLTLIGVNIDVIIQLNGAVIGFFFIYFLPLIMHLKCVYFNKKQVIFEQVKQQSRQSDYKQIEFARSSFYFKERPKSIRQSVQGNENNQNQEIEAKQNSRSHSHKSINASIQYQDEDKCSVQKGSLAFQVFDWIMLIGMILIGVFILIDGIYSIFAS